MVFDALLLGILKYFSITPWHIVLITVDDVVVTENIERSHGCSMVGIVGV